MRDHEIPISVGYVHDQKQEDAGPESPKYIVTGPEPPLSPGAMSYQSYTHAPPEFGTYAPPQVGTLPATPAVPVQSTSTERICGLKKWVFWTIIVVLLVAAAIGGGVGGYFSTRSSDSPPEPKPEPPKAASIKTTDSTALAVSAWVSGTDNAVKRILYFQTNSGELYYRLFQNNKWGEPKPLGSFDAKNGTPLAELNWPTAAPNPGPFDREIRLYYIRSDNTIADAVWSPTDKNWVKGDLEKAQLEAHRSSRLTTVKWAMQGTIAPWVYFQDKDRMIREYGRVVGGNWTEDQSPRRSKRPGPYFEALSGSGMTTGFEVRTLTNGKRVQGMYIVAQAPNGDFVEKVYNGSLWGNETETLYSPGGVPQPGYIANSGIYNGTLLEMVRVAFVDVDQTVKDMTWTKSGWSKVAHTIGSSGEARIGGGITAESVDNKNVRVWFNKKDKGIGELVLEDAGEPGAEWKTTDFFME